MIIGTIHTFETSIDDTNCISCCVLSVIFSTESHGDLIRLPELALQKGHISKRNLQE